MMPRTLFALYLLTAAATAAHAAPPLAAADVFELQWAADPQISPDGRQVAYVRYRGDVMKDTYSGDVWIVSADGREHRPLVTRAASPANGESPSSAATTSSGRCAVPARRRRSPQTTTVQ